MKVAGEGEGAEESMKKIVEIVRTIVQEAALVPALYLRSREGSENARLCSTFDEFLLTARDRLKNVIGNLAARQLKSIAITSEVIAQTWTEFATDLLWPSNYDAYYRTVYSDWDPDIVHVNESVLVSLKETLCRLKEGSQIVIVDPDNKFALRYRAVFRRYAGGHPLQYYYVVIFLLTRIGTGACAGALNGWEQGVVLVLVNIPCVVLLAAKRPYKNRLQNLKQLVTASMRLYLLLLSCYLIQHEPSYVSTESNPAANEATFIIILVICAAIEAVSPILGCIRAYMAILLVITGLMDRLQAKSDWSLISRWLLGAMRTRTALYLNAKGLKRQNLPWSVIRNRYRSLQLASITPRSLRSHEMPAEEESRENMDFAEDAEAIRKWLSIYVLPRMIAVGTFTANSFASIYLGTEDAMEDLRLSSCSETFLLRVKERFYREMLQATLKVLPTVEEAELITKSVRLVPNLRVSMQPRPTPPWLKDTDRKIAQLLLTEKALKLVDITWVNVEQAVRGQLISRKPGVTTDEDGVVNKECQFQFGISEQDLNAREELCAEVGHIMNVMELVRYY
uniref:Uncharacterized protein n=1 Tax=Guillardia theta TaxID=55529 RepID=A0A7S4KSM4_GUITH